MDVILKDKLDELAMNFEVEKNALMKILYRYYHEREELERIMIINSRETHFIENNDIDYNVMMDKLYDDFIESKKDYIKNRFGFWDKYEVCFRTEKVYIDKYLEEYRNKIGKIINQYRENFIKHDSEDKLTKYLEYLKRTHYSLDKEISKILKEHEPYEFKLCEMEKKYEEAIKSTLIEYIEIMIKKNDFSFYKVNKWNKYIDEIVQSMFMRFIKEGNLDMVRKLIYMGASVKNEGILKLAIWSAEVKIIEFIELRLDYAELMKQWNEIDIEQIKVDISNEFADSLPLGSSMNQLGLWYCQNAGKSWCKFYDDICLKMVGCKAWHYSEWKDRRHIFKKTNFRNYFPVLYSSDEGKIGETSGSLYAPNLDIHNMIVHMINDKLNKLLAKLDIMYDNFNIVSESI